MIARVSIKDTDPGSHKHRMKSAWLRRPHYPFVVSKRDVYIPHPSPDAAGNEEEEAAARMGATLSLLKVETSFSRNEALANTSQTLVIPALISLILYLLVSYLIVPVWKHYRGRYSNYLPLDTISTHTTTWRQRAQSAVIGMLVPSSWRSEFEQSQQAVSASDFDEEEGEELFEVDDNRREALSLDARRGRDEHELRLSRDLEEGFKDDSDDEGETEADPRRRSISR